MKKNIYTQYLEHQHAQASLDKSVSALVSSYTYLNYLKYFVTSFAAYALLANALFNIPVIRDLRKDEAFENQFTPVNLFSSYWLPLLIFSIANLSARYKVTQIIKSKVRSISQMTTEELALAQSAIAQNSRVIKTENLVFKISLFIAGSHYLLKAFFKQLNNDLLNKNYLQTLLEKGKALQNTYQSGRSNSKSFQQELATVRQELSHAISMQSGKIYTWFSLALLAILTKTVEAPFSVYMLFTSLSKLGRYLVHKYQEYELQQNLAQLNRLTPNTLDNNLIWKLNNDQFELSLPNRVSFMCEEQKVTLPSKSYISALLSVISNKIKLVCYDERTVILIKPQIKNEEESTLKSQIAEKLKQQAQLTSVNFQLTQLNLLTAFTQRRWEFLLDENEPTKIAFTLSLPNVSADLIAALRSAISRVFKLDSEYLAEQKQLIVKGTQISEFLHKNENSMSLAAADLRERFKQYFVEDEKHVPPREQQSANLKKRYLDESAREQKENVEDVNKNNVVNPQEYHRTWKIDGHVLRCDVQKNGQCTSDVFPIYNHKKKQVMHVVLAAPLAHAYQENNLPLEQMQLLNGVRNARVVGAHGAGYKQCRRNELFIGARGTPALFKLKGASTHRALLERVAPDLYEINTLYRKSS